MKIYLTAIIKSKPEHLVEVKATLTEMVKQSRKEPACIQYDLHEGITDDNLFVFYEIWQSESGLADHNEQAYIKAFASLVSQKLQEPPIIYKTRLL